MDIKQKTQTLLPEKVKRIESNNINKNNQFILDDDNKFYHIYYVNNNEVKKVIQHDEVVKLLKKGISYKYTSNYGLYRLANFKSKVFLDSFQNTGAVK